MCVGWVQSLGPMSHAVVDSSWEALSRGSLLLVFDGAVQISKGQRSCALPDSVNPELADIAERLLVLDPAGRPRMEGALHPSPFAPPPPMLLSYHPHLSLPPR